MKKQIEITVPKDWSAISYRKYLKLQKDLENYKDEEGGYETTLLYHLVGITPAMLKKLDKGLIDDITNDLSGFLNKSEEYELQRTITIGDVEYGFEPNLSKIEYGAYLDLTGKETIEFNDEWVDQLSILYRPITNKRGAFYDIEEYKGVEPWDSEKWYDVGMDFHFGCFFFFFRLWGDLLNSTLKYTANQMEMYPNIKSILEKSGKDMQQLWNSPKGILPDLMKLQNSH